LVVDPWGEVLLDMGEEVGVGFADIDLARITDVRSRLPTLSHRRPVAEARVL
jgi:predicted amidohydrolase